MPGKTAFPSDTTIWLPETLEPYSKNVKILIAEDNEIIQLLHGELLNTWGYDFDMAANGMEAVTLAKKNNSKYDLGLMDVEMPGMNGIEATKVIRKSVKYFPIMALTGNRSYEQACYEAGMDDFSEKPCLPQQLLDKINALIGKSYKFILTPNGFRITEEMPMDKQHAQEIKKLKEKGLVKVSFGSNVKDLILHKNTTNKISHDFNVNKDLMSVFLNHDPDKPTRCELYKDHCHITQTYLDEEDYENEAALEKAEMEKYTTRALKADEDKS